jgi:ABC-type lipoprotein release transport system permease subunit
MNIVRQTVAVTAMNLRALRARLGSSLVSVIGIAGVVMIFVGVLSISEGFRRTLEYPEDFEGNPSITVLPAGTLLDVFMTAPPVSLIARRGASSAEIMARGTVDRLRGIVLSYVEPVRPDSTDRRRWRDSLLAHGADTASARSLSDRLANTQWLQTVRPLVPNDTIVLELVSGRGDTVAVDTVQVRSAPVDAFLRRRP